jgi:outer membrane protein assembly factor BamE (lipoprotein component of BamABCDE complex)
MSVAVSCTIDINSDNRRINMKHIRTALAIICLLTGFVSSCSSRTPTVDTDAFLARYNQAFDKYNQITADKMSYDQIVEIMGEPGKQRVMDSGTKPPIYTWSLNEFNITAWLFGSGGDTKIFSWQFDPNIHVLKNAVTTRLKLNSIEIDMTYEQVASILGTPGLALVRTETYPLSQKGSPSGALYAWWIDETSPHITIQFIKGKVTNID